MGEDENMGEDGAQIKNSCNQLLDEIKGNKRTNQLDLEEWNRCKNDIVVEFQNLHEEVVNEDLSVDEREKKIEQYSATRDACLPILEQVLALMEHRQKRLDELSQSDEEKRVVMPPPPPRAPKR